MNKQKKLIEIYPMKLRHFTEDRMHKRSYWLSLNFSLWYLQTAIKFNKNCLNKSKYEYFKKRCKELILKAREKRIGNKIQF